ncbi:MAG: 5'/3'-nucleotidase SurE [Desulfobacterales bacterium]
MRIVLTNDDGIDMPGLEALYRIAGAHGDAMIVAPDAAQSGVGHRVTTRTPIPVARLGDHRYRVGGTPADCVRLALKVFAPDAGWIIAGINPGANLGSDIYQSGTVAAAREAAILGCRSMAVSQYIARDCPIDWDLTGRLAARIIRLLMQQELPAGCYWNINLPHPLAAHAAVPHRFCPPDTNPHQYGFRPEDGQYHYEGTIHERPRDPGRDVAVCFGGEVSITRLSL